MKYFLCKKKISFCKWKLTYRQKKIKKTLFTYYIINIHRI